MDRTSTRKDPFWREYTSPDAVRKYSRGTAGAGISYLLDHDYRDVYLAALRLLPPEVLRRGVRMLEFGCGAGMNLLHLAATLDRDGIAVASATGCDFSPVLIEAADREALAQLEAGVRRKVRFCVARNETLAADLAAGLGLEPATLDGSFDFIVGVNTIRYCHRDGKQLECARDIFHLLAPGGVCVVIDMNDRFPMFRSALKNRLLGRAVPNEETYLPALDEYAAPFERTGFEMVRKEHFCWIPHSAGPVMGGVIGLMSPLLDTVARSRAMRSLVVVRKPGAAPSTGKHA